jgi:hypothetical protein
MMFLKISHIVRYNHVDNNRLGPLRQRQPTCKVKIDQDDDIDDLCTLLKTSKLTLELKCIGISQLYVRSLDSLYQFQRDDKIKSLPATAASTPLMIGCTPLCDSKRPGNEILTTPSNQASGSSISNESTRLLGFGSLPSSFRVDSTDGFAVTSVLYPSESDIVNVSEDMSLAGELMDMIPRGKRNREESILLSGRKVLLLMVRQLCIHSNSTSD